jgi:hypothetical protein
MAQLSGVVWHPTQPVGLEVHANGRVKASVIVWAGTETDPQHVATDEVNVVEAEARERFIEGRIPEEQRPAVRELLGSVAVQVAQARNARPDNDADAKLQGTAVVFPEEEPWPDSVDGVGLLDTLRQTVRRYAVLSDAGAVALALWVVLTYLVDAVTLLPKLALTSATKRCGKTTVLTVLGAVAHRALATAHISPAALFRIIELYGPSLLIDEADTFLDPGSELIGLLNAGHMRGARVIRTVGDEHEPRAFNVFCPQAIACIGRLPTPALRDRCIEVRMQRKEVTARVEPLRQDRLHEALAGVRRRCARYARDHAEEIRTAEPAIPTGLDDRQADNWRFLLAIADRAGGPWPRLAREAAVSLSGGGDSEGEAGEQIVADLFGLFQERETERLSTAEILAALCEREDRPWAEWGRDRKPLTGRGLAKLLGPFDIKPVLQRSGKDVFRGYNRADFTEIWQRYPSVGVTAVTPLSDKGLDTPPSVTPVTLGPPPKSLPVNHVTAVTAVDGEEQEKERHPMDLGRAAEIVCDILGDDWRPIDEVAHEARRRGIGAEVLEQAKAALGVGYMMRGHQRLCALRSVAEATR